MALVHSENRVGKPISVADYHLLPVEKTLRIQPPGMWGVLLWRRPSKVIIQHPDTSDEVIEIHDPTREAQIFLVALGVVVSIIILLIKGTTKGKEK
jgi:hypothetical protein